METKDFLETPPWEWPPDAGERFKRILTDRQSDETERVLAAQLAGDFTVINDELAAVLVRIAGDAHEPDKLRARAAISLGAILEFSDDNGFDDPDDAPISEATFHDLQATLRTLYFDETVPKEVRRRILEASVRAQEPWQKDAIARAYATGDREWMLSAVFSMGFQRGFDKQILAALQNPDNDIHVEALISAGSRELDDAWDHVVELIENPATPKPLLLAAMSAAAGIRPIESSDLLIPLTDSDDEEIATRAEDALSEAGYTSHEFDEDAFDEPVKKWIN